MASVNGEGSVLPQLLAEVHELRQDMRSHVEVTEQFLQATKQRFARMDQGLERIGRLLVGVAEKLGDHEQ